MAPLYSKEALAVEMFYGSSRAHSEYVFPSCPPAVLYHRRIVVLLAVVRR